MHLSVRLPANILKTGKPSGAFFKRGIESPIRYRYISKSSLNPSQSSPRPYIPEAPQDWSFQFRLATGTSGTIPDMKRSSSGSVPATQSTSKKRKTDSGPKYYAVKAGFRPGVYATYAECSAQTAGFKGAVFKSFTSRKDAEDFAAGKVVATPNEPAKFYAVAVGNPTGIYGDWSEAAKAITGVKGPKYKKFASRAEAVDYIKQFGNKEAIEALGEKYQTTSRPEKKTTSKAKLIEQLPLADGIVRVYTDGSSLANGKAGSRAGVGVYFGDGDARNISERLEGEPQTNQRAELMAMLRALQVVPLTETVQIFSDSQYSINCVTQWAIGWKKKDWKTANGDDVKNQDIIRVLLNKMDERAKVGANTLFQWVKGHATDKGNVAADRLAVAGAKMSLTM